MAVTPAGAEVSSALATNWKKIWKKELKPLADKRYYTKKKSDKRYQPKGSYETAGSGYTKAETYSKAEADAKYAGAGSSYSKAESDGRYARAPQVIRGVYAIRYAAAAAGNGGGASIAWGINLAQPPTTHYIAEGAAVPAQCSGTPAAPGALPGHLCVFQGFSQNDSFQFIGDPAGNAVAGTMGAYVATSAAAAGEVRDIGSWALGVGALSAGSPARQSPDRAPLGETGD